MPDHLANLPFAAPGLSWGFWASFLLWMVTEVLLVAPGVRLLGANKDRGSALFIIGSVGIAINLAFVLAYLRLGWIEAAWLQWLGLALMLGGIAWRLYVVRYLGRDFTPLVAVRAGQRVTTGGPFRLVRHPSYLGTLITMIGFGLALGCWPAPAAVLLVSAPAYLYRIHVEEQIMMAAFGDEYRRYAASTRRLIPFVW